MSINRYSYLKSIFGWGLGQAMSFFIGIVIGGNIITGRIGGIIYPSNYSFLIPAGIGGFIGGGICGVFLGKIIVNPVSKEKKHHYIFIILAWAFSFMLGNLVYYFARISSIFGDLFQSFFMIFITIISSLIIGSIGGIATSEILDIPNSKMILVVGGWCLGLLLGCGISQVVVGLLNPIVPHNWDFFLRQTFMNSILGFLYGAIAGWFGILVMSKVVER